MIPIRPKPFQDEILSSWLIRSALLNGSDPEGWGGGIWPDYRVWTRDVDRYLPKDKTLSLCKAVSMTYDEINQMTLEPLIERITKKEHLNSKTAWTWVIPTGTRNRSRINGLHFCPDCLGTSPVYFKKQWRLSWNVACARHGILLQLHCPNCYTVFSPHLIDYRNTDVTSCKKCGLDLKKIERTQADRQAISLQEQLNHATTTGIIDLLVFPVLDKTIDELFATVRVFLHMFYKMNHCQAIQKVVIALIGNVPEYKIQHPTGSLEMIDVESRHVLMSIVAKLFKHDLAEIIAILLDCKVTRQMFFDTNYENSPTIKYIFESLADNARSRLHVRHGNNKIEPKSKEHVEEMMNEIRKYL